MAHNVMDEMVRGTYDRLMFIGMDRAAEMYSRCFRSTWETTLERKDGTVFLVTGDIPAMWLRDSSAQVFHYLPFADRFPEVKEAIASLITRQLECIVRDPYANAFNREANDNRLDWDDTNWTDEARPWIWERKYEVDSLCAPIRLMYAFREKTGCAPDEALLKSAARAILDTFETEQDHARSPYRFVRKNCPPSDTLPFDGRGTPVEVTGMTWSGFRPSDDACMYGYLIPSNFFAAKELGHLSELLRAAAPDPGLISRADKLARDIENGLRGYAVVHTQDFGDVYAYETDGMGHYNLMDDANVPSLLSLPYLGCVEADDPVYLNTRRMLLSRSNPYYYEGTYCRGIGSPHTPAGYIWPISLCVQGLTSRDGNEIRTLVNELVSTDAGTYLMHESFDPTDPSRFTRPWFAWANSIFSEFIEHALPYLGAQAL